MRCSLGRWGHERLREVAADGVTVTLDAPKTMKVNTTISFTVRVYGSDRDVTYTTTYPDLIIGGIPKRGKSNTFTDKTVKGGERAHVDGE
ncbi:hypothetical protein HR12_42480 [Microbacterium sp. SUBG005]|nr:hypothetical protein HR12_42480 [Microbacterium sp. SUBG005]